MDVTDDLIRADPHHHWLPALRVGMGALALVVGWFILTAVFGGSAAHAASEAEPDPGGSSLAGALSHVASSVADPSTGDLQGMGADVAEPLDAIVGELPVAPEVVGKTPVHDVTSPVVRTAQRILVVVPEVTSAAVQNVTTSVSPVTAATSVAVLVAADPPRTAGAIDFVTSLPGATSRNLGDGFPPLTPDQPTPVPGTTTTGASAGSAGAPVAGDLNSAGWSPLNEDAESPTAHNDRCPASATYDSDSTPD